MQWSFLYLLIYSVLHWIQWDSHFNEIRLIFWFCSCKWTVYNSSAHCKKLYDKESACFCIYNLIICFFSLCSDCCRESCHKQSLCHSFYYLIIHFFFSVQSMTSKHSLSENHSATQHRSTFDLSLLWLHLKSNVKQFVMKMIWSSIVLIFIAEMNVRS